MGPVAHLYLLAHQRFVESVSGATPDQWAAPVPACPGWSVHDLLAHVSGVADDIVHGRVEGAATDPWTDAQVVRGRPVAPEALLARWAEQAAVVAERVEAVDARRAVIDCATHVCDLVPALGGRVERADPLVRELVAWVFMGDSAESSVRVHTEVGTFAFGPPGGPALSVQVAAFEAFRSRLGRRSRRQVEAYEWSSAPGSLLDEWFVFGPADQDVVE